ACTSRSWSLRPIRRFTPNTVRCGLVTIWRLLAAPTTTSPSAFHDTIDGVVRPPSWLWITAGSPPSSTATQLFVLPRSIPMTRPMPRRNYTLTTLLPTSEQLGERGLGQLERRIEVERIVELDAGVVEAAVELRLTAARVRHQRTHALGVRLARQQLMERALGR